MLNLIRWWPNRSYGLQHLSPSHHLKKIAASPCRDISSRHNLKLVTCSFSWKPLNCFRAENDENCRFWRAYLHEKVTPVHFVFGEALPSQVNVGHLCLIILSVTRTKKQFTQTQYSNIQSHTHTHTHTHTHGTRVSEHAGVARTFTFVYTLPVYVRVWLSSRLSWRLFWSVR